MLLVITSPVNEPVYEPVCLAKSSLASFTHIVVPSTLTPIESPLIKSNKSALKLA